MKRKHVPVLLLIGFIIAGIYGCGGGGGGGDVTLASPGSSGTALALNAPSQMCAACHGNPTTTSPQVASVYLDASGNVVAGSPTIVAEYSHSLHNANVAATCAQCHTVPPGSTHPATGVPSPDQSGICLTCHSPAAMGLPHFNNAVVNTLAGFVGDGVPGQYVDLTNNVAGQTKCAACHNPHDTTSLMPTFKQYAESGHGDVNGAAWIHYRWKGSNQPGAGGAADPNGDRTQCQRCHNSTSFVAFINGVSTGTLSGSSLAPSYARKYPTSAALDVSSNLTTGTNKAGFRYYYAVYDVSGNSTRDNTKQVLRCDACHSDYSYKMRTSPAVVPFYRDLPTRVYKDVNGGTAFEATIIDASGTIRFPDVGKSNLCLNCHSARDNGYTVKSTTTAFTKVSFVNSHYLVGGGTVYRTVGYTFEDTSANITYDNRTSYEHKFIGTTDPSAAGTGSGGPCVGCHMTSGRHTFKPITKDEATGQITAITSTVCAVCHSGITPAELNTESANYQAGVSALEMQLQNINNTGIGFYFSTSNPYIFATPYNTNYTEVGACTSNLAAQNWQTGGTFTYTWNGSNCTTAGAAAIAGTAGTGKNNMGAAFNLNVLKHEPGAYTHNRRYAKRLIWDSINWLKDNNLNNEDVGTAIDALAALVPAKLTEAQRVAARTYLCGSANTAVGALCPRP